LTKPETLALSKMTAGLSNDYIEKTALKAIKNHYFLGVFPCDRHPTIDHRKKFSIVFNTGHSQSTGEHFIAIYCNKKQLYYFDSLGSTDIDVNIANFIQETIKRRTLILCNKPIQHPISSFCGFYCIAFLLAKDKLCDDSIFYSYFNNKSLLENDKKVVYFITTCFST